MMMCLPSREAAGPTIDEQPVASLIKLCKQRASEDEANPSGCATKDKEKTVNK